MKLLNYLESVELFYSNNLLLEILFQLKVYLKQFTSLKRRITLPKSDCKTNRSQKTWFSIFYYNEHI